MTKSLKFLAKNHWFYLPLTFIMILQCIPDFNVIRSLILVKVGGFSWQSLALDYLFFGVTYSGLLLVVVNKVSGLNYSYLIHSSLISIALYQLFMSSIDGWARLDQLVVHFFIFLSVSLCYYGQHMTLIAGIGRYGKLLPEGFETTGVSLILAFFNLGATLQGSITLKQLRKFDVKAGYYKRIENPCILNFAILVVLNFGSSFFLGWKLKGNFFSRIRKTQIVGELLKKRLKQKKKNKRQM